MTHPADIRSRFPQASASFLARNPQLSTTATTTPVKSKTTMTESVTSGCGDPKCNLCFPHDPHDVTGGRVSKPRIRQDRGGLNRTEAEFRDYLATTYCGTDRIMREGLGFRIGNGCVYWPDFVVPSSCNRSHVYEVKGFMRDDAAVKLKVAASKFPTFKFFLVTKRAKKLGGGWDIQEVLP